MKMKRNLFIGLGIALVFVSMTRIAPVKAQNAVIETLYLSDSADRINTWLYTVELDSSTGHANLTPLPTYEPGIDYGKIPFKQVDALACTPDGTKLYAFDKYQSPESTTGTSGMLGYYEISSATFVQLDYVKLGSDTGSKVPQIVLAAFSPSGVLYAASDSTDSLYTVDTGTCVATLVGQIRTSGGTLVDVSGADIVFAADGTLYFWANRGIGAAPRGLYTLTLPASPGTVVATHLGAGGTGSYFTGLAIRAQGFGDLVGSTHDDEIFVVDKTDGTTVELFLMYKDGDPYNYEYGDMTSGALVLCTKTIGYWKNHSWNGATITICGQEVDEELGKTILWDARGNNFSMLFAQLIAAKLNVNNATGIPVIDTAEAWLCEQFAYPILDDDDWMDGFSSKQQKREAAAYWEALDFFNNQYHCDEE